MATAQYLDAPLAELIGNLPCMAYRCRNDRQWTMEYVSAGCLPLTGYKAEELIGNSRVAYADLIHPDDRETVWDEVQAAIRQRRHFESNYRITTADGKLKWVWEQGTGVFDAAGELQALDGFITEVTERVVTRQLLEQRVAERTHQLETLLDVSHNVGSTLELEPLLDLILDQLKEVVVCDGAAILELAGDQLEILAYHGPLSQPELDQLELPLAEAHVHRQVVEHRQPLIIDDVHSAEPLAAAYRDWAGEDLDTTLHYIRAWLGVPLVVKNQVIGMLSLHNTEPGVYTGQHAHLVLAFASHAAVAIENARLYAAEHDRLQEAERRRRVAESLRGVVRILNSNRSLDDILAYIVTQARELLRSDAVVFYRREGDALHQQASAGLDPRHLPLTLPATRSLMDSSLRRAEPIPFTDLHRTLERMAQSHRGMDAAQLGQLAELLGHYRSQLVVPVIVRDEVYGGIVFYFQEAHAFSPEDTDLGGSFGDQAALAIENARLHAQAQQAATAEERQRLARELHDAVTQTLFSASLVAEVLPRLWERDRHEGERRLRELRELTRGALAEMRTLLLELRPVTLSETSLGDLLRQLGEAMTGRSRVPVAVELDGECDLPTDARVALYRIAQEALNNIAKHADASRAGIALNCARGTATMRVWDNGKGFEPQAVSADHLGLKIMHERAAGIGAGLEIASAPDQGTEIVVRWRAIEGEEDK